MARKRSLRKTRRRVRKGGMKMNMMSDNESQVPETKGHAEPELDIAGGKKRKTMKKGGKKRKKRKGTKGKKMNEFFKLLIDAKKKNADSFVYKGKTYKKKIGTKNNSKLVVYKKA
jgi:hypothetical protein